MVKIAHGVTMHLTTLHLKVGFQCAMQGEITGLLLVGYSPFDVITQFPASI